MKLFVTGASGFIGGSFAAQAVRNGHQVRGLVRSPGKAAACEAFGIVPVLGTLADRDLLAQEAREADAVVNAASSDDREAVEALLGALAGSGKALLHTSGSSIVADHASGEPTDAIYDEDNMPAPSADKAARVALDRAILSAPGIRTIVLCNPLIFGDALGPDARSVQLPLLIDDAREGGRAHYIGRGLNRWSTVHIADVVDLYLLALEKAVPGTFAFVESGEAVFRDMARTIGEALGQGDPVSMTIEAAEARWGRQRAITRWAPTAACVASARRAWAGRPSKRVSIAGFELTFPDRQFLRDAPIPDLGASPGSGHYRVGLKDVFDLQATSQMAAFRRPLGRRAGELSLVGRAKAQVPNRYSCIRHPVAPERQKSIVPVLF